MFNPTSEWSEKERLQLIFHIADELKGPVPSSIKVLDVKNRIQLIATKSSEFLEANREEILKGQI